jgi:excisionase family DNA binding protein
LGLSKELKDGAAVGTDLYMTVKKLSQRWSISLPHAYKMIDRGEIPSLRVGCAVRVPIDAVEKFERNQLGSASKSELLEGRTQ